MVRMPSVPRVPGLPDPLRRIRIARDFESVTTRADEGDLAEAGINRDSIEKIWTAAVNLYRSGVHPALQLCVRRRGVVVLDRAIGHARGNGPNDPRDGRRELATPETPFCMFSAAKGITALLVFVLHERGLLNIHDRVADHIPEYAAHGKGEITIAHVLSHRSGVAKLPPAIGNVEKWAEREWRLKLLCDVKPAAKPGKSLAYHAISGGFIIGEIIERVTGQSIRDVLAQQILDPLGFRWTNYGVAPEDVDLVGRSYPTGLRLIPPVSTLAKRTLGLPWDDVVELFNDPRTLTAVIPSANVVSTANEMSRFYEVFRRGGELDGVRVMRPETLELALTEQAHLEPDAMLGGLPVRYSYGLMLGARLLSLYGRDTQQAFGHLGLINIVTWADPERALSAALVTSGKALLYPEIARFGKLMQTIATQVPKGT